MIYWYQNLYMDETVEKNPMEKELRRAYLGAE